MCGIAGAIDLTGQRAFPRECIESMAASLAHRGPDDEQVHLEPGVALGVRRLSIIDIAGGRQPMSNETGDVWVAYEGELYEYPQLRRSLLARGHHLATRCDTEAWVHLYEDHGEGVFERARGQFGVALWDRCQRTLLLGRDRAGIAPFFFAQADGWLLWASEIKGILASGLLEARPDPKGIDYFFNFFSLGGTRTCFEGIEQLPPGHFLKIRDGHVRRRQYWDLDFPDAGRERRFDRTEPAAEELEHLLRGAVARRLVGEVPLCCYISGGLDSTTILGLSSEQRGDPVPSFTVGLDRSGPCDERSQAAESAELLGSPLTTLNMPAEAIANAYPELILAAEGPVLDTSAACMMRLAEAARERGFVVSLTGEGADEALAGYRWMELYRVQQILDGGFGRLPRRLLFRMIGGGSAHGPAFAAIRGVRTPQQVSYELMAIPRESLYSDRMWWQLEDYSAYDDLIVNQRIARWHPLNRSLYAGFKIMMPGMLLAAKGDRATRSASVEGRYPFLDESVVDFCASLDPRLKFGPWHPLGRFSARTRHRNKWLLRQVAAKVLPAAIANRPKTMFRADFSQTFLGPRRPAWVDQLLSARSLEATGYFRPSAVQAARAMQFTKPRFSIRRFAHDMALTGVISTQLWHHLYCGGGLADLPSWTQPTVKCEAHAPLSA